MKKLLIATTASSFLLLGSVGIAGENKAYFNRSINLTDITSINKDVTDSDCKKYHSNFSIDIMKGPGNQYNPQATFEVNDNHKVVDYKKLSTKKISDNQYVMYFMGNSMIKVKGKTFTTPTFITGIMDSSNGDMEGIIVNKFCKMSYNSPLKKVAQN